MWPSLPPLEHVKSTPASQLSFSILPPLSSFSLLAKTIPSPSPFSFSGKHVRHSPQLFVETERRRAPSGRLATQLLLLSSQIQFTWDPIHHYKSFWTANNYSSPNPEPNRSQTRLSGFHKHLRTHAFQFFNRKNQFWIIYKKKPTKPPPVWKHESMVK